MASWGKTNGLGFARYQKRCFGVISLTCLLGTLSSAYADILNAPVPPVLVRPSLPPVAVRVHRLSQDIQKVKMKTIDEKVAVQTLLLEAVGEGHEGMVAVGEVIRNRSKLFKKDFEAVCLAPKQFSCWNDRKKAARFLKDHKDYYPQAQKAWEDSAQTSLTQGATDYHSHSIRPYWADAYRALTQIGRHIFYSRR